MILFYVILGIVFIAVALLVSKGRNKNAIEKLPDSDETYDTNRAILITSVTIGSIGVIFLLAGFRLIRTFDMIVFVIAILIIGVVTLMVFGRKDV